MSQIDLVVETVPVSKLTPDPRNARKHGKKNLDAIASSLKEFGQRRPLVVTQQYVVVAGNGTLDAAKALGWTEIAVTVLPFDDPDKAKAYALADNRTAELAEWDEPALLETLGELDAAGWDIASLGFDLNKLDTAEMEEQSVPDLPTDPISKLGDLWVLGDHRVLCGDATSVDAYDALLKEEKADLVWTDPPYGVSYVGKTKDALTIENDDLNHEQLTDFLREAFGAIYAGTRPGACWYVAAPSGNLFQCFSIPLTELEVWKHTLVWVKDTLVMGRADYHYRHESIFYGWTPGAAHQAPPDRKQDTIWEIPRPKANKEHPTMKPLELIARAIRNSSNVGQIVLDPFGGSGSTLLAAHQTGRIARLIELDPRYVDVIVKRWEDMTGEKAVLRGEG
ncbi:putative methylase [uncultured Caudovirales phage]|uniref:Putative methylase n=1 Tax=uncultured Caudovirales phage TaxID=2100421 RepID=A0A6J5SSM7_9CAUD|nr:putative methylase [uncultured Caudovirales phage]